MLEKEFTYLGVRVVSGAFTDLKHFEGVRVPEGSVVRRYLFVEEFKHQHGSLRDITVWTNANGAQHYVLRDDWVSKKLMLLVLGKREKFFDSAVIGQQSDLDAVHRSRQFSESPDSWVFRIKV